MRPARVKSSRMAFRLGFAMAAVFLLCAGLAACGLQEQSLIQGQILLEDNFANRENGWPSQIDQGGISDYLGEAYRIQVAQPNMDRVALPASSFQDVLVRVEASQLGGPDDNRFGILCRYQNNQNYYAFLISSDGYFALLKVINGQLSLLGMESMLPHPVLNTPRPTHLLEVECRDSLLALSVDGTLLAAIYDTDLKEGRVGLIAGNFEEAGVEILFDNFQVRQP